MYKLTGFIEMDNGKLSPEVVIDKIFDSYGEAVEYRNKFKLKTKKRNVGENYSTAYRDDSPFRYCVKVELTAFEPDTLTFRYIKDNLKIAINSEGGDSGITVELSLDGHVISSDTLFGSFENE